MNLFKILILYLLFIIINMFSTFLCYLGFRNKSQPNIRDVSKYNTKSSYDQIIPNLYIGNKDSAKSKQFMKDKKIKVVINCSKGIPNSFESDPAIEYYRLPVDDSLLDEDIELMTELLPKYVEIVNTSLINNKPVLVHCYAGRQRSACLIAAYLIFKKKWTLTQTYKYIISKRKEAFHYGTSYNFHKSLLNYKNQL